MSGSSRAGACAPTSASYAPTRSPSCRRSGAATRPCPPALAARRWSSASTSAAARWPTWPPGTSTVVFRPPDAYQQVAQLDVRLRRHAEPAHGPAGHERFELVERTRPFGHAFAIPLEPRPQQLLGGDRRDELHPTLARVEREHAARTFTVGQVQALRVCAERVRPIAAPGDRDLVAGRDEHNAVVKIPRGRGRHPALFEELLHREIVGGSDTHLEPTRHVPEPRTTPRRRPAGLPTAARRARPCATSSSCAATSTKRPSGTCPAERSSYQALASDEGQIARATPASLPQLARKRQRRGLRGCVSPWPRCLS